MDFLIIFLAIIFIGFIITVIIVSCITFSPKRHTNNENKEELIITNKLVEMISRDFANAGWTEWEPSIHKLPEQLARLKRATDSVLPIQLFQYNPNNGIAKMRGGGYRYYLVSGYRCSCPDFRERQLPCKHMYCLATMLPDYKKYIEQERTPTTNEAYDNVLFGLNFSVVGRNQKPVKKFIVNHGGTCDKNTWRETTAIVIASETLSQRLIEAQSRNVEVMTFDELKVLFNTYTNEG